MAIVRLDGGMGTQLQARGLKPGECPEDWNIERPDDIAAVHRAYVEAGAEVVYANTFGANALKYHGRHRLDEVIRAGVSLAKRSGARVALDIGPTGRLLKPAGDLDFEAAYDCFAEMVRQGAAAGADLVVIETMGDVFELKAAVLAAKESCPLPVWATVTLGEDGKLLTGGSVESVSVLLESLGVDAYGFNCGLGPDRMLPFVERLAKISTKPIIVKPNAGLPRVVDGRTVFDVGPEDFARHVARLIEAGASIVGGCCGTTPLHLKSLTTHPFTLSPFHPFTFVSSATSVVELKPYEGLIIGERINPTGKKLLKEAFLKGDTALVLREAVRQVEAGAQMIDINCGVPGIDESATLDATVGIVQGVVTCPLQIDTANAKALEGALRHVNGKPLVNSVNGTRESMDAVFPLVKRYGGAMVALCLDENGIPPTAEGRVAIARKILAEGAKYGFAKEDFVVDALTLAVSADPQAAVVTLETVKRLTEELGVNTILGVSNVSFGLPNRPVLNSTMYALAKRAGLSAAIANPSVIRDEIDPAAEDVLLGRDANCARWVEGEKVKNSGEGEQRNVKDSTVHPRLSPSSALQSAIEHGLKDDARAAAEAMLAGGATPMSVIEGEIVPALEKVGGGFETGKVFLPQLLMAADAAGEAFSVVRAALTTSHQSPTTNHQPPTTNHHPIVLATVKGDVHDIGKNIVRALLENYGFEVIDLGRDVPPEKIVETAAKTGAMMVGLSALMTTTVGAMAETIRQLKQAKLACRTVVGGAVVTQEYADSIGADFYAKDAMRTVRIAESL